MLNRVLLFWDRLDDNDDGTMKMTDTMENMIYRPNIEAVRGAWTSTNTAATL